MEIPGYYYDSERKRYFRLCVGNNRHNPLTTVKLKQTKAFKALSEYQSNDRSRALPKSIRDTEINVKHAKKNMFTLREEVLRSQLKAISSKKLLQLNTITARGIESNDCTSEAMIGLPSNDQLFAVTRVDCDDLVYAISVNDVFDAQYDINHSKRVIACYPSGNRVIDISLVDESNALAILTHHFDKYNRVRSSYTINTLKDLHRINPERQVYEYPEIVFSATHHKDVNILGVENGIKLFKPSYTATHRALAIDGNVSSLKFANNAGNVFISGTNKGMLYCYDIRENNSVFNRLSVRISDKTIAYVHVLSDENSVITSSHNNNISLIDLRMIDKPFVTYADHVNGCKKIAFSVDESCDVLCSSGDDNIVRFWSLFSGKLLYKISSHISEELNASHSSTNVWYSHSWKFLTNETKPLLFSLTENKLNVLTTDTDRNNC